MPTIATRKHPKGFWEKYNNNELPKPPYIPPKIYSTFYEGGLCESKASVDFYEQQKRQTESRGGLNNLIKRTEDNL